jgi:hypothetical protein
MRFTIGCRANPIEPPALDADNRESCRFDRRHRFVRHGKVIDRRWRDTSYWFSPALKVCPHRSIVIPSGGGELRAELMARGLGLASQ